MRNFKIVIDERVLSVYADEYFSVHTKARKRPIQYPYHESINKWMIMRRPMMNALKQKWKDFIQWMCESQGLSDLRIGMCEMIFVTYYKTNKDHDTDNSVPKFIIDGFVQGGLVEADDGNHITSLTLQCGVDKTNPRTEIYIREVDKKELYHG